MITKTPIPSQKKDEKNGCKNPHLEARNFCHNYTIKHFNLYNFEKIVNNFIGDFCFLPFMKNSDKIWKISTHFD